MRRCGVVRRSALVAMVVLGVFVAATCGAAPSTAEVSRPAPIGPPPLGEISGTVTSSSGTPLAGVTVQAYDKSTGPIPGGTTTTAADGTYTFPAVPAGSVYLVGFSLAGYAPQWWNDKPCLSAADVITVTEGQVTSGIDAVLQPETTTGSITGHVTDASSDCPVAGATVVVHNYYGFTVAQTTTAADGTWGIGNLGGGVYRVEFQAPPGSGLLGQWWNNEPDGAHSDRVGVTAGGSVGNIDATLTSGARISGTVTDAAGPVAGTTVGVFAVNASNQPGAEVAHTTTAADGTYSVSGLQAGNYDVLFDPPAASADVGQWYNNASTAGGATQVTLSTSGTATANAQLTSGQSGSISGTVTDGSGNAIAGSTVLAVAADGRAGTTATTAADGSYTVANLDVGIDTVWFLPPAGSSYGASVWNLAVGTVLPVTIDQGSAITGIDATLSQN